MTRTAMNSNGVFFDQLRVILLVASPATSLIMILATGWFSQRLARRFRAAAVDLLIAVSFFFAGVGIAALVGNENSEVFTGAVLGASYLVLRDGWAAGRGGCRSIGKKMVGLRVKSVTEGRSPLVTTILRNSMFTGVILCSLEVPWAWVIVNGIIIIEVLSVVFSPGMVRLGDILAGTRVVRRVREKRTKNGGGDTRSSASPTGWGELR